MSETSGSSSKSSSSASSLPTNGESHDRRFGRGRKHSDTHVFPSTPFVREQSRKTSATSGKDTSLLGQNIQTEVQWSPDDKTKQLCGGLQWLFLQSLVPPAQSSKSRTPLTENALRQLNEPESRERPAKQNDGDESTRNS